MKLSHLAQSRIPLYIVNVSKLIFYHPPLASTEFFEFSSIFSDLQKQQVLSNMVGFYNLPSAILDSDDRLMELEKKALRPYHPIHFEINAKVLIATFSASIDDQSIQELEKSVLSKLKEQMGFSNKPGLLDRGRWDRSERATLTPITRTMSTGTCTNTATATTSAGITRTTTNSTNSHTVSSSSTSSSR